MPHSNSIFQNRKQRYTSLRYNLILCILHCYSGRKSTLFYNNYDEQKLWNILIDFCSPQHCNIGFCHSSGILIPSVK